jgi:hypothetical protein
MNTIIYQGQEIEAQHIGEINLPMETRDGMDNLFRDAEGCYYLRRETYRRGVFCAEASEEPDKYAYRCFAHRINVNAAILWALEISADRRLREDAANLLMEGRSRVEPNTSCCPTAARNEMARTVETGGKEDAGQEDDVQEQGSRRFVFRFDPTPETCGLRIEIKVTDEQWAKARELAACFEMNPREFLRRLAVSELPGQPGGRDAASPLADQMEARHITFACHDEGMAARIQRAAQACGETVDEYVAGAVGRGVDADEENMIVHPLTGELLCDDNDDLYTELRRDRTAPRIGEAPSKQQQIVDNQRAESSIHLDNKAAALVRRYLEVTPWNYTAVDIVNGCIDQAMEQAFDNVEEAEEQTGLDSEEFHDGAWGYVEEDICAALQRRTGGESARLKEAGQPTGAGFDPGKAPQATSIHRMEIEFDDSAFGLMKACAAWQGHDSPEELVRVAVVEWVFGWARQDITEEALDTRFDAPPKVSERERRRLSKPEDMGILAAAEPAEEDEEETDGEKGGK